MPSSYKRICPQRGTWTEADLSAAMQAVRNGELGSNAAARNYGIPSRTLRRRLQSNNSEKGRMGPDSSLGAKNEEKLVKHIIKLQNHGFSPRYLDLRQMAYKFAVALKIPHKFKNELAGKDWLRSFLRRHPELSVRKAEGVSIARGLGMSHDRVNHYFNLIRSVLEEFNLFNKPSHIFNMDETGLQLNNVPGKVIALKGSKNVTAITSGEKGETITVVACCNAEGTFLPPISIFKGKNVKAEYEDGMPPGSKIYMNEKSAYINSDLFLRWIKTHFTPRKPEGTVLLLVDGHTSHCCVEMLEFARQNDIIMISFPSHTTHWLQPLDRTVFKSLKSAYAFATNNWIRANPSRKINRLQFGHLMNEAWCKAAVPGNAISAFKATGVYPFNPEAIPEYAFLSETDIPRTNILNPISQVTSDPVTLNETVNKVPPSLQQPSTSTVQEIPSKPSTIPAREMSPQPSTSTASENFTESIIIQENSVTPGKILDQVSPPPKIRVLESVRRRAQHISTLLTGANNIEQKKQKKKTKPSVPKGKGNKLKLKNRKRKNSSTSESEVEDITMLDDGDSDNSSENDECAGCGEKYSETTRNDDWIKCIHCEQWVHDGCSKFVNFCDPCGRVATKKKN